MKKELITIKGYEGFYYIYENGFVYSIRKKRFLKQQYNTYDYLMVYLTGNNCGKWFMVHRLVAIHFIGYPKDKKNIEIDHVDENKGNNHYSNLEWVTHSENILRSFRNGRSSWWKGKTKPPYSEHTKYLMSQAHKKRIQTTNNYTGKVEVFESIEGLCSFLNICTRTYNRNLGGYKQYSFKELTDKLI